MKFRIRFQTLGFYTDGSHTSEYLVEAQNPGGGLDLIEAARELSGQDWLTHTHVEAPNSSCDNNAPYRWISVCDFETIKKIAPFQHATEVAVIVPEGFLGKYVDLKHEVRYHYPKGRAYEDMNIFEKASVRFKPEEAKKLSEVKLRYVMDESEVLNAWIEAGCPKFWGVSPEQTQRSIETLKAQGKPSQPDDDDYDDC